VKQVIKNGYYWLLDYLYVFKMQLASIVQHDSPAQYQTDAGQPIVLIPGVYENWRFMRPIAKVLHAHGYDVHVIAGLGYNRKTVEEMAEVIQDYLQAQHLTHVTLVTHSKGGLIGKFLLGSITDANLLRGMIALNAPFSGSKYAYILPVRSLRIFIPHSRILSLLALDTLSNSKIVSIYGLFDPHIPGGSMLEGAKNIRLETYGHFRIISDRKVHKAVIENIRQLV